MREESPVLAAGTSWADNGTFLTVVGFLFLGALLVGKPEPESSRAHRPIAPPAVRAVRTCAASTRRKASPGRVRSATARRLWGSEQVAGVLQPFRRNRLRRLNFAGMGESMNFTVARSWSVGSTHSKCSSAAWTVGRM